MEYSNLDYLKKISRGNNEFIVKMIDSFLEQVSYTLTGMEQQLVQRDWDNLFSAAHNIKPSLDIMGLHKLKGTVETIEKYTENKIHLDDLSSLVAELKTVFEYVTVELKNEKQKLITKN
jgi:HPt (histidine-containing phosphotransfer) domain-containing protein